MNSRQGKEAKALRERASKAKEASVTFNVPARGGCANAKALKQTSPEAAGTNGSSPVKLQGRKGPAKASEIRNAPVPDTPAAFSLKGLLAAQRLTRELKNRASWRKQPRLRVSHRPPVTIIDDQVPVSSAKPKVKFSCSKAEKLIKEYLQAKLAPVSYDPVRCASLTTAVCEEIKSLTKKVTPARYKLICQVTIGSNEQEDIVVTSQCLWDPHSDNFTSCSYVNRTLFCVVSVYAVYLE
ncbi:tctex1 domain-containing protein 1-like [Rhinatrema bivittatum]|uniref:tctex1 domain-containing protein 1-like n=1 Tax=Rhinatrema bivittatum TaxID=194408 RepID=UPI00112BF7CD|nr:tctex1 domain-containing protein 1-like [Rhinatrema bivittatum]XP_029474354.1 tctex1 domain-containing protein 1-like [Rhinatrema bivittatum]